MWTKEAEKHYTQWYSDFNRKIHKQNPYGPLANYNARKQIHLLKIAMCISIIQNRALVITVESLIATEDLFHELEIDLESLLEQRVGSRDTSTIQASEIIRFLRENPAGASKAIMVGALWRNGLSARAFDLCIETLASAKLLQTKLGVDGLLWYSLQER